MAEYIIYHNNRCSKSRGALALLKEKGINPEIRNYLKETPSEYELKGVLRKLGIKAEDLVRRGEAVYKENFRGKEFQKKNG